MYDRGYNINIMKNNTNLEVNIDEKLASLRFICDNISHIQVDTEKCAACNEKNCLSFCPAKVYSINEETNKLMIEYENCLECGTCRICCPKDAISWEYPKGSKGVSYRFG